MRLRRRNTLLRLLSFCQLQFYILASYKSHTLNPKLHLLEDLFKDLFLKNRLFTSLLILDSRVLVLLKSIDPIDTRPNVHEVDSCLWKVLFLLWTFRIVHTNLISTYFFMCEIILSILISTTTNCYLPTCPSKYVRLNRRN